MAKQPKKAPEPIVVNEAYFWQLRRKEFHLSGIADDDSCTRVLYGVPSRSFSIGELVLWGARENAVIVHSFGDGVYIIEVDCMVSRDDARRGTKPSREFVARRWFDIDKMQSGTGDTKFSSPYRRPSFSQSDIDSLIHMHEHDGFVFDPMFQRNYVWTDDDKQALIDTIFDHGAIGSFIFSRSAGWKHEGKTTVNRRRTITGEMVDIPASHDYTVSVIDGQQRLTTILSYVYNRWAYRGKFFKDLSHADQYTFCGSSVTYAFMNESDGWTDKDRVRIFIQTNKGVPQSPEHLANVIALYNSMEEKS